MKEAKPHTKLSKKAFQLTKERGKGKRKKKIIPHLHSFIVVHNLTQNLRFHAFCVSEFKYIPLSNNGIFRTITQREIEIENRNFPAVLSRIHSY